MSFRSSLNNFSRKNGEGSGATEDLSDPFVNPAVLNRYKRSFRALRFALEKADVRCPPNAMKEIINFHSPSLKVCLDCFDNTNIKNDGTLQGLASEALQLNIRATHYLMKSFESEYDNYHRLDNGEYLSKLLEFYYEERLNVIKILSILFYYYGDTNWYYYDSAEDFMENLDLEEFMDRVFDQFQELADIGVQAFIPENMKEFGFSCQYIKEQIEILELLCLIYKRQIPRQSTNKYLIRFLTHCMETKFGYNQFLTLHIHSNGHDMLTQVNHFTQILMVIMALVEFNFTEIFPSVHTKNKRAASSNDVRRVTERVLNMDNDPSNGIFLWLWASYLTHIQHFYDETNWPNEYEDLESYFNSMISANAAKAYGLNVLDSIYNIFKGPCFRPEELNVKGYKKIFKTYFISIFEAFKIQEIPKHQLLVECFAQVFVEGGPCSEFFKEDSLYEKRTSLFNWAISKFPQNFHPLMRLYTALSGDRDSAEEIFVLLENFCQCCFVVRDDQIKFVINNENRVYAKQPIKLFENIYQDVFTIPENTPGYVIEQLNGNKLVQWNIKYSGWQLFLEMLESFPLIQGRPFDYDPTLTDDPTTSRIKEILQLLYALLSNSPDLIEKIFNHLETCYQDNKPHNDLAFTIFAVIEYVMNNVPDVLDFVTAGLQCIKVLLPYFKSRISSYLIQSGFLPNLTLNISNDWMDDNTQFICKLHHLLLHQECVGGRYPITIAVLDLAIEFFNHVDDFDSEKNQELWNDSKSILLSFTSYILNVIFVSYDRWRYKNELERIQIGIKCLTVFNKILLGCPPGSKLPNYYDITKDISKDSLRNPLQEYLWDHFMMNEGLYHVLPLFYIIKRNKKFSINVERTTDSRFEQSDTLLELALAFLLRLFKFHKIKTLEISWLELTMLDRTNVNFNKGLINIISSYVSYPHRLGVSILSCELMTLLFSCADRSIPFQSSLSGLFGNEAETIIIYNKFIERFTSEINVKDLRVAILDFFTVSTKVHVGLSIFGGVDLISMQLDRKGKGKESDKKKKIRISVNIIDVIIGLLKDWKKVYDTEPKVLLAAVRFLSTLWENVRKGEFIILKKIRENNELWNNISDILHMRLNDDDNVPQEVELIGLSQGSRSTVNVEKIRCGRNIKGFLFRLLGRELCLFTNQVRDKKNKSRIEFLKSLPAEGIREILKEVLEEDMLEFCLDRFTQIDQQPCEESHYLPKTNTQVVLFKSWKYFIEIASYILSDGFWITEQKKDISRLLLGMTAERLVEEIHRGYNVEITIRDDLADLLLHLMEQLIISKDQSQGRIILYAELVTLLYNALTSVINPIQNVDEGHFTSTTYRPILQSLILCLRVLHDSNVILKSKEKVLTQFQKSCQSLLSELCEFLVAMTKKDDIDENREEDILIILTLLEYLIQPLCSPYPSICLGILMEKKMINLLLNMFVYSMSVPWKNRPKFSDGVIYFLLTLANLPIGAMQLFRDGVMAAFCNNRLSSELQEGKVEPNLEENWHKIWCLMLAVITAMLRTVERKDLSIILRSVVGFIGLYRKQIQQAMECKLPTNMFKLEEIQYITILFYHLSIHLNSQELDFANECLIYYDDTLLILLAKLTYLFTHPKYSSRVMIPLTPEEIKQSTTLLSGGIKLAFENVLPDIDLSSSSDSGGSEMNIFLQRVQQKLLSINRNILATYINLTESHNVFHMSIPSWSDQLVYFEPLMKVSDKDPATIATLFELIDHGMTLIQLWEYILDTNNINNINDLEFWQITWKSSIIIIEMSFVLATSQLTTYFFSEDRNKEDVEDLFTEIFERLLKVTRVVKKLLDMGVIYKSELKSFEVVLRNLQNFLTKTIGIMN
ncbi:nucleoporin subcomplex protein binding to Pom34-domain-containing protein [Glomus cerebriforme]|uniref:Nucleoporin subcomplex protein binding to Pom34-domain-containing protein n=1 Tax=Glomus cerebriforme TaxID=658196 RepID=A0A397TG27_9GLOM|nr:nucleoporin subcomplex protein binding to Pom34-domain-containing protein [Glomus cerebriforme]